MKFTVDPAPFLRIVELAEERVSNRSASDVILCLAACDQRVWVECGDMIAQTEAMVWENGQCHVPRGALLNALKSHEDELELLVEGTKRGLRFGKTLLPVSHYYPWAVLPSSVHVFLASNLGMVHWNEAELARS